MSRCLMCGVDEAALLARIEEERQRARLFEQQPWVTEHMALRRRVAELEAWMEQAHHLDGCAIRRKADCSCDRLRLLGAKS